MNVINVNYNNLSALKKADIELYQINITNHPDMPAGVTVTIVIPKKLFDLANS